MRVLLSTDTVGGVWTFTQELCTGLLERGHSVALVSVGRNPSAAQLAWCARLDSTYAAHFRFCSLGAPLEWMQNNENAYSGAEAQLLAIAREFKAEILHANQFCFGALPLDIPTILTAHSDVLSWAEACRPGGLQDSDWLRRYRGLVQAGLDGASSIVAPTRWMGDALRRVFPQSCARAIRVIPNGRTAALPRDAVANRLLQAVSLGRRWDDAKGLSVFDGLHASMPIVLAGETTLDALPEDGGGLSEDQVLALLRMSSVYVAASIYEPFGLAPLEAALCGCAVVANDIASLREVWGDAAIFYRGQAALKAALDMLFLDKNELSVAQLRSHARALELTGSRMVDEYIDCYSRLVLESNENELRRRFSYAS